MVAVDPSTIVSVVLKFATWPRESVLLLPPPLEWPPCNFCRLKQPFLATLAGGTSKFFQFRQRKTAHLPVERGSGVAGWGPPGPSQKP